MWTEIFVTQDVTAAQKLNDELKKKRIMARLKNGFESYRILVPYAEVNEALNLIIDLDL